MPPERELSAYSHEPVTFAVYGLHEGWSGPRWLAHVDGPFGQEPTGVILGHGWARTPESRRPWVAVGSYRADAFQMRQVKDVSALALVGLYRLVSVLDPFRSEEPGANRTYWRNAVSYVQERADRWKRWATTRWDVDGSPIGARFTRFAGGWTGFTTDAGPVDLVVVGRGLPVQDLQLRRLFNTREYHVDLDAPVPSLAALHSQSAALGNQPTSGSPVPVHADQRRFLGPPE